MSYSFLKTFDKTLMRNIYYVLAPFSDKKLSSPDYVKFFCVKSL